MNYNTTLWHLASVCTKYLIYNEDKPARGKENSSSINVIEIVDYKKLTQVSFYPIKVKLFVKASAKFSLILMNIETSQSFLLKTEQRRTAYVGRKAG